MDAQRGRFAEAAAGFRRLRDERPEHAGVRFNLALSLAALARIDEATDEFRRVLQLDPMHEAARRRLAALLGIRYP